MQAADGVIVSSSLKRHGRRDQTDPIRCQFVEAARRITSASASGTDVLCKEAAFLMILPSSAAHNLSE